jgi:hypothetical protein
MTTQTEICYACSTLFHCPNALSNGQCPLFTETGREPVTSEQKTAISFEALPVPQ